MHGRGFGSSAPYEEIFTMTGTLKRMDNYKEELQRKHGFLLGERHQWDYVLTRFMGTLWLLNNHCKY